MNPVLNNDNVSSKGTAAPDNNIISAYKQFRQSMKCDPKQKVMDMLNAGQIDKSMVDRAISYVKLYGGMFK